MDVKISVDETGEVARQIRIEIPRTLYDSRVQELVQRTAGQVAIKGFRKGKAPRQMVEKLYGDKLRSDVLGDMVSEAYKEAVRSHDLNVVGQPQISFDTDIDIGGAGDFKLKADVALYPVPQLKDYHGLEISVVKQEVTDASLEHELIHLREHYAELRDVERTITEAQDIVTVSYSGKIDGEPFPGSDRTDCRLHLGKSHMPPGFAEALVNKEVGKELTFELAFPDDSPEPALRGKQVTYSATISKIQCREMPEINDELAKLAGLGDTVDELKTGLKKALVERSAAENERAREDALFKALAERNPFEIPQVMVDEEVRSILFEMRILDPDDKHSYDMDLTRFREALGAGAEFRVRRFIMLKRLIEQENLTVDNAALDEWFDAQCKEADVERRELERAYGYPKNASRIKDVIARQRAAELLFASAKISETIQPLTHEGCEHE